MTFDNNHYPNRKDNRRVYKYNIAKQCDRSCRNNGSCDYCRGNRMKNRISGNAMAKLELAMMGKESDLYLEGTGLAHGFE
jgi:hypothetical protein